MAERGDGQGEGSEEVGRKPEPMGVVTSQITPPTKPRTSTTDADGERARPRERGKEHVHEGSDKNHRKQGEADADDGGSFKSRRNRSHREKEKDREKDHSHRRKSRSRDRDRKHHHSSRKRRSRSREHGKERSPLPGKPGKHKGWREGEDKRTQDAQEKIERDTRTVFAFNMTTKADEWDLFNFFSSVGTVKDVQVIYDRSNPPKRKGMAYVEMNSKAEADAALALSGQTVRGYPVMVKHSEAEKNIAWEAQRAQKAAGLTEQSEQAQAFSALQHDGGPAKLKVHGLHPEIGDDDLRSVFEPFGSLLECYIIQSNDGSASGSGVVTFHQGPAAVAAITQLNGYVLANYTLQVKLHEQQVVPQTNQQNMQGPSGQPMAQMPLNDSSLQQQPQQQMMHQPPPPPPPPPQQSQQFIQGGTDPSQGGATNTAASMVDQQQLQQLVHHQQQNALQDRGRELFDDESQGFKLDSSSRVQLMQRYAGGQEVVKEAQQSANAAAPPTQHSLQAKQEAKRMAPDQLEVGKLGSGSPIPTECLLLKNMFDPSEETEEEWWLDIQEEVREEAQNKYGQVEHVWVDRESNGFVYLKFGTLDAAKSAYNDLSGRYFNARRIAVEYQFTKVYDEYFGLNKKRC